MKYNLKNKYITKLRNEVIPDNRGKLTKKYVNAEPNIFFRKVSTGTGVKPLSYFVKSWGCEYSDFIDETDMRVQEDEVIVVEFNPENFHADKYSKKLMYYTVSDKVNGSWIRDGVIGFQNGKMIFHT